MCSNNSLSTEIDDGPDDMAPTHPHVDGTVAATRPYMDGMGAATCPHVDGIGAATRPHLDGMGQQPTLMWTA